MLAYTCSHLLTPNGIIAGTVIVSGGRIQAAGPLRSTLREFPQAARRDLGTAIVLPGLVNAHTHMELAWIGALRPPGGDYVGWLRELLRLRELEDATTAHGAASNAIALAVARGTVAFGDICNGTWIADCWRGQPASGWLFHELLGLDENSAATQIERAEQSLREHPAPAGWSWSLVPHAPHTTSIGRLRQLADAARRARRPCSIHLAETPAESSLLTDGSGDFREFFASRGFLPPDFQAAGKSPLEQVAAAGMLGPQTLLVHAVEIATREIPRIAASGATVVSCPRSNAYLATGVAAIPGYLRAGIPVALGTDSLASVEDLDMFAEIAALLSVHPSLSPQQALRAATSSGAAALGLADQLGSIEAGKLARLTVVPFDGHGDPLERLRERPRIVHTIENAPWESR